jgi:two-component sensor histidine kinase
VRVLGLVIHELATNAAKYGAFSTEKGRVEIFWSVESNRLSLSWIEHDGPRVAPPTKSGFGTTLIQSLLRTLGTEPELDFCPTGLVCRLNIEVLRFGEAGQL